MHKKIAKYINLIVIKEKKIYKIFEIYLPKNIPRI